MRSHRYFKMGKYLVCIDQSLLHAIKHLGFGYDRNKLASIGIAKAAARAAIKAVAKARLGLLRRELVEELPGFGEIGLQVHGGSKLFDFERLEVTKIFDASTTESDAAQEIAAARQVSALQDAPEFIDVDPGLAWYREEYIRGTHATDADFRRGKALHDFYPAVEACLLDLLGTEGSLVVDAGTHFETRANTAFAERWLASGLTEEQVNDVSLYLRDLRRWLVAHAQSASLELVPVHGDFSLVNAIATSDGLRFIDWEGVSPGGVYDDVFNFLFVERYYKRTTGDFAENLTVFLDRYGEAVCKRYPQLAGATEVDRTFVRRQYYLERLSLLLERKASTNLCNVVHKSMALFRQFDSEVGAADIQVRT